MKASSPPNVLIVLSDQLRRQALSTYGDPNIVTPHVDALAERGVRFEHASSTCPICVPFRFTLMTGLYAHDRKVPAIEYRMSPAERTLADEFNEAGYETIYTGKWHLDGGHGRMGSAIQCGRTAVKKAYRGRWRKWMGFELRNGPFDTYYFEDDDPVPRPVEGYQTDGLFDLAMDYLERRDPSRPFCMVISVEPPHDPFEAPEALMRSWEAMDIVLPPNVEAADAEATERFMLNRKRYYAMVENLDWNMGRLGAFLLRTGLHSETVVLFLSDHGELGGAHGLRGKQWPYEESTGIPLIVADPRHPDRAGAVVEDPVSTEDLFPTILGLAGLKPRDALPGENLTPLINGSVSSLDREGVMLEFIAEQRKGVAFHDWVWRGFRTARYKYTVRGDNHGGTPWQFFDLAADPWEQRNLLEDPVYRAEITRHHDLLRQRMKETDDHFVLLPAFGREGLNTWD
ncbi:MAG: sulfatase [Gemmatimonadetes bacterium]|nr:sulfatase [Gemmatimonadota bacterium]